MELLSIFLARAVGFIELSSLDPFGKQNAAESTASLKDRYQFAQSPQSLGEVTIDKGAEFLSGRLGSIAIDKMVLYPNGIMVDTRSSTDDSERVIQDLIDGARELLGLRMSIDRRHVVSQITFRSEMRLSKMNPILDEIAEQMKGTLAQGLKQSFPVEPTAVIVHLDATQAKIVPAKFTIERREGIPFSENVYFSSAPLSTGLHFELVQRFENSLL